MQAQETKNASTVNKGGATAGSLFTVLSQALHTNDSRLIDECLREGSRSEKVIAGTVDRLLPKHVQQLLQAIIERYRYSRSFFLEDQISAQNAELFLKSVTKTLLINTTGPAPAAEST